MLLSAWLTLSTSLAVHTFAALIPTSPVEGDEQIPFDWEKNEDCGRPGFFQPAGTFETFDDGIEIANNFENSTLEARAVTVVRDHFGLPEAEIAYRSGYASDVAEYAYLAQTYNGIPFINAVANLVIVNGKITAFGSSFVKIESISSSFASVLDDDAITVAESSFNGTYNGHPIKMEHFVREDGHIALVYVAQIQNEATDTWYEVYVDAHSGDVVGSTDFVSYSAYRAVDISKNSIAQGASLIRNPQDKRASPIGWHSRGGGRSVRTWGNNVVSYIGKLTNTARQSKRGLVFDYKYNRRRSPETTKNRKAALVNAFYIINTVHDFTYRYGFTERAFNFQYNNFNKGGKDKDPVLVFVQNPARTNNANFATPPDGQPGKCNMFLWTKSKVFLSRDESTSLLNTRCSLDVTQQWTIDILVHEMTHGISKRMTGGGTARCLGTPESRGLGEGWSDAMADWTQQLSSARVVDFPAAAFSGNSERGIRKYPYSTDRRVNPFRYSDLRHLKEVHAVGTVWATILHDVYAALVKKRGFDFNARHNPASRKGNAVFLHLFLDSLAIQKCNPTFLDARKAWLQADRNRYGGRNRCLLWRTFAARGMGIRAGGAPNFSDCRLVPRDCRRRREEGDEADELDEDNGEITLD